MGPYHLNLRFPTVVIRYSFVPIESPDGVPHFFICNMITVGDAQKSSEASHFCSLYLLTYHCSYIYNCFPLIIVTKSSCFIQPSSPTLRVLHLTDIHLDLQYAKGAKVDCGEPLCCRDYQTDLQGEFNTLPTI